MGTYGGKIFEWVEGMVMVEGERREEKKKKDLHKKEDEEELIAAIELK